MNWLPILKNTKLELKFIGYIENIISMLESFHYNNKISVLSGSISSAIFYYYYSKYSKIDKSKLIRYYVDQAIKTINCKKVPSDYLNGLTGTAWTINFLYSEGEIGIDYIEPLIEVDEYLFQICIDKIRNGDFDFLYGGMGYGFYFIERIKYNSLCNSYLCQIVKMLDKNKRVSSFGCYWQNNNDIHDEIIDFSLAHGQATLLIFFSKLLKLGIERELSNDLLSRLCNFICYNRRQISGSYSYPDCIERDVSYFSPVRWCHGALGIGFALIYAGTALNNIKLINEAIISLESQKYSIDYSNEKINSSIVCHGSLGIAHMHSRLYNLTKRSYFLKNAILWYKYSNEIIESEVGFKFQEDDGSFIESRGVLTGLEGIGLALLSSISSEMPDWDKSIILS